MCKIKRKYFKSRLNRADKALFVLVGAKYHNQLKGRLGGVRSRQTPLESTERERVSERLGGDGDKGNR